MRSWTYKLSIVRNDSPSVQKLGRTIERRELRLEHRDQLLHLGDLELGRLELLRQRGHRAFAVRELGARGGETRDHARPLGDLLRAGFLRLGLGALPRGRLVGTLLGR